MHVSFFHIAALVVAMTITHFVGIVAGLYEGDVWIDIPLHIAGGSALGLLWVWILQQHSVVASFGAPSSFLVSITIVSFALTGSFVWEIAEFSFWQLLPEYATAAKFYSPTVTDVLSDLAFGMLGGALLALIYYRKMRR